MMQTKLNAPDIKTGEYSIEFKDNNGNTALNNSKKLI